MFNQNAGDDLRRLQGSFAPQRIGGFDRDANLSLSQPVAPMTPMGTPKISAPRSSPFDRDHISETLANMGQAFLSNQNFGEGLGAAAGVIGRGYSQIRQDQRKAVSYGGPGDQFEIVTDGNGNRSYRQVPEFAQAAEAARRAKIAPTGKDLVDIRARALSGIGRMPAEERRAAYQDLITNPSRYGLPNAEDMPGEWSDTYGAIGSGMGMTVGQGRTQDRSDDALTHRKGVDAERLSQGASRVAQGAQRLRQSPPSTRRPRSGSLATGMSMGGYTYIGGDPQDPTSWRAAQ